VFDVTGNGHEAVPDHRGVYDEQRQKNVDAYNAATGAAAQEYRKQTDPDASFKDAVYGSTLKAQGKQTASDTPKIIRDIVGDEQLKNYMSVNYHWENVVSDVIQTISKAGQMDKGQYYLDMGILSQGNYVKKDFIDDADTLFTAAPADFLVQEGYLAEKDKGNTKKVNDARKKLQQTLVTGVMQDGTAASKYYAGNLFSKFSTFKNK